MIFNGESKMTFKPWEEMTTLEQYGVTYSDMFKDAYGFRPTNDVSDWTEADFEEQFAHLGARISEQEERRERQESQAVEEFEDRIYKLMDLGARNRDMAIRWLDEAYETNGDMEFLEYNLGLPFGYIGAKVVA
jgi:hypothetical protein